MLMLRDAHKFHMWKESYANVISTVVGIIVRAIGKLDSIPVMGGHASFHVNTDMLTDAVAIYMYQSSPQGRSLANIT
jgi:hypothetical protein